MIKFNNLNSLLKSDPCQNFKKYIIKIIIPFLIVSCDNSVYPPSTFFLYYDIYVSSYSNSYVYILDGYKMTYDSIYVGGYQYILSYDDLRQKLYGANGDDVFAIDIKNKSIIDTEYVDLNITNNVTYETLISDDKKFLFVQIGEQKICVIDIEQRQVLYNIETVNALGMDEWGGYLANTSNNVIFIKAVNEPKIIAYDPYEKKVRTNYLLLDSVRAFFPKILSVHPAGDELFISAGSRFYQKEDTLINYGNFAGNWLISLNLNSEEINVFAELSNDRSKLSVTPDGKYLIQTSPGSLIFEPPNPYINIYNLNSNSLEHVISTTGIYEWQLGPDYIDVTSDSRFAIVATGSDGSGSGPLIIINIEEGKIEKLVQVGDVNSVVPISVISIKKNN